MFLDMVGFAKVEEDGLMEKMWDTKIRKEKILKTKFSFLLTHCV
jgi:N-acetylglutamate synthase-like GNAT family acetyltransferase